MSTTNQDSCNVSDDQIVTQSGSVFRGHSPLKGYRHLVVASMVLLLAGVLRAGYAVWGSGLIEAIYFRWVLGEFLQVMNRQQVHDLSYYLARADTVVGSACLLLIFASCLFVLWGCAVRCWPDADLLRPPLSRIVVAVVASWGLYLMGIPLFQLLPYWFWSLNDKELPWIWLALPMAGGSAVALRVVFSEPERRRRNALILFGLGVFLQHAFALMEGRNLDGIRDRALQGGNGFYARAAVAPPPLGDLLKDYDGLLREGRLASFPHATKPPGRLLFAICTAALSVRLEAWLSGGETVADTLTGAATFAALVFPFLSSLTTVLIYRVALLYSTANQALVPAALWVVMPNVVLMTLHADQYLHPVLTMLFVLVWFIALNRRSVVLAVLAGAVLYFGLFFSFALITLLPGPIVIAAFHCARCGLPRVRALGLCVSMACGVVVCHSVFYGLFHYDAIGRYDEAIVVHQQFKIHQWHLGQRLYFAVLNMLDFGLWCGLPAALLCLGGVWRSCIKRQYGGAMGLEWALAVMFVGLLCIAMTVAETGRLWLFLTPLVALCAGNYLSQMAPKRGNLPVVVLLQLITVLVFKDVQDFF